MYRFFATALLVFCGSLQAASFPKPDLTKARKIGIWASEYHVHQVTGNTGSIPLLTLDGKQLGPLLSASDFCQAALERNVRVGTDVYSVSGTAKAEPEAQCPQDVGRSRFTRAKGAFGDGVNGYQLVPYRSIATDLSKIPAGTLVYIPAAVGVALPDGSVHDGYFFAADTDAMKDFHIEVFDGIGAQPFGFVHGKATPVITAYMVEDDSVRKVLDGLQHHQVAGHIINLSDLHLNNFDMVLSPGIVAGPAATGPASAPAAATPAATPSSSTIPEFGKPRGDYVPCLFTTEDRFRFKNAVFVAALKNAIARQALIKRLTPDDVAMALKLIDTMKSPSDIASVISALVDAQAIHKANADKNLDDAVEHFRQALMSQGVSGESFDVSCSQSVLTYEETSDIFGKRVANNYVAIQVVVRNLNPDREFLMHDVQIAVDYAPPSGVGGATDNNSDKPYSDSPDNRFVAGRDKLLVRGVALRGQSDDPRNRFIRVAEAIGDIASAATIGLKALDFRNGVSVFRSAFIPGLKNVFPDYTIDQLNRLNDLAFSANTSYKLVISKNGSAPFVTFIPSKIFAENYKTWGSNELHKFNEKVYVVFAGVHITEENSGQITATDLTCPADKNGFVDVIGSSTTVDCTLKGDNLQSVTKVRLRNAHESTDSAQVDADVSSAGSVKFDSGQLKALSGAEYSIILVDKSGHEISTSLTLKFTPSIASVSAIDVSKCTSVCTATVDGGRLANIQSIVISDDTSTAEGTLMQNAADNTWTVSFPASSFKSNADYAVKMKVSGNDKEIDTGKKVTVSGAKM